GLEFCAFCLSLPAATTTTVPRARAELIAFCIVVPHGPVPPNERLATRAGFGFAGTPATVPPAAHTRPSEISDVYPPQRPSTRTGSMRALNATPATPDPLLVRAAIVPATCVPCQLELLAGVPAPHSPAALQSPGSRASASLRFPSRETNVSLMKS